MCRLFYNLLFRFKFLFVMFRDLLSPPIYSLMGANIRLGFDVLDYGCGPGGYTIAAAEIVGNKGKVYALDTHPSAVDRVQRLAARKGLKNIKTILSDGSTGLRNASVDVVLLHELSYPDVALQELHRVLRPNGIIYFSDHQILIRGDEIASRLTNTGLFRQSRKALKTFNPVKTGWRRED